MENNIRLKKVKMDEKISSTLKQLRLKREITQEQLAKDVCERTTITNYESGTIKLPSALILKGVTDKLGITLDDFFTHVLSDADEFNYRKRIEIDALMRSKKYEEAIAICSSITTETESIVDRQVLLFVKGCFLMEKKMFAEARDKFNQAMELTNPKDKKGYFSLNELRIAYARAHNNRLDEHYSSEETVKELEKLNHFLKEFDYMLSPRYVSAIASGVGDLYRSYKMIREAEDCLNYANKIVREAKIYDDYGRLMLIYSTLYRLKKDVNETSNSLNKAYSFYYATEQKDLLNLVVETAHSYQKLLPEIKNQLIFSLDK